MPFVTREQLLAQAQGSLASQRFADAEAALRQLISFEPQNPELLHQAGLVCYRQRKLTEAEKLIRQALTLNGSMPPFHLNLGEVLRAQGRLPEAIESYQRAIKLQPNYGNAHFNLGVALKLADRLDEAIEQYQQVLRITPNSARAYNNLGTALRSSGRVSEAIPCLRKSLELTPTPEAHSNLLYAMWFDGQTTVQEIFAEHQRWAERWAAPLAKEIRFHENDRNPDRRLRVGYVSPDFRGHPIGLFMEPILAAHDHTNFEIFCYADVPNPDFMTDRLRSSADSWVWTQGMTDAQIADKIRADRIDVLVDLTAHMARNRMLVFARKPAPVQVSYLAYAATTGLPAIDYRFSDAHLDPEGVETPGHERVIRLPQTYWCYKPQIDLPEVGPVPSETGQPFTFACYNTPAKINAPVIALWAQILQQVSGSRLRLMMGSEGEHFRRQFAEHGVEPDRIVLHNLVPYHEYFPQYLHADVALDPFPYNGGTTTLDALYMGVPVVTLTGSSGMSRAGVSILTNAGLPELIAKTPEDYVRIAVQLAGDPDALRILRQSMRDTLSASPLMDAPRFVRALEGAYRTMWQEWTRSAPAPSPFSRK